MTFTIKPRWISKSHESYMMPHYCTSIQKLSVQTTSSPNPPRNPFAYRKILPWISVLKPFKIQFNQPFDAHQYTPKFVSFPYSSSVTATPLLTPMPKTHSSDKISNLHVHKGNISDINDTTSAITDIISFLMPLPLLSVNLAPALLFSILTLFYLSTLRHWPTPTLLRLTKMSIKASFLKYMQLVLVQCKTILS